MRPTAKTAAALLLVLACAALPARAEYPERPITGVVPFAAGGNSDVLARVVAIAASKELGQQIVIENKAGAGGNIGITQVAHAKPDGYTLLFSSIATTQNPAVYKTLPYDPLKEIIPVAVFGTSPLMIVVNVDKIQATNLKDFIELLKKNPGKYNLAAGGGGKRMSIELMFVKMGVPTSSVELVNYQSSQDATTAVIKGETEFTLGDVVTSIAAMETGKIRVLAVAGEKRSPKFPNVPTAAEAGLANYVDQPHVGVYAPGGTSADIMAKLNAAVNRALATPDVIGRFEALGYTMTPHTQKEFDDIYRGEIAQWKDMAQKAKIELLD